MVSVDDLSGFWAGMLVQGSDATRIFVNLAVEEGIVKGSYEAPTSPSIFRTGTFEGTYNDAYLTLTLSQEDAHGPLEFNLQVIEKDSEYMMLGHTVTPGGTFASVTFFRFGPTFRQLPGIW
jgi:hypothetical protein